MIWVVTFHRDGVLVTTPLVKGRVVRDVDRLEVIQVLAVSFCPPVRQLRSSVLLVILSPAQDRHLFESVLLSWRPLLSNGLVAMEHLRVSFLLNDSLVQDNTALSKLEIWL